jgi:hypothetical protein
MLMMMMMREEKKEDMLREKSNNPNLKGGEKYRLFFVYIDIRPLSGPAVRIKDVAGQCLADHAVDLLPQYGGRAADLDKVLGEVCARSYRNWWQMKGVWVQIPCKWSRYTIGWGDTPPHKTIPTLEKKMKASSTRKVAVWILNVVVDEATTAYSGQGCAGGRSLDYLVERGAMAWNLLRFLDIIEREGVIMSDAAAEQAQKCGELFLLHWTSLAAKAGNDNRAGYKLRPKLHYFAHLIEELTHTYENPRRQELSLAEDFIGKMKRIGKKCHRKKVSIEAVKRRLLVHASRWNGAGDKIRTAVQGHLGGPGGPGKALTSRVCCLNCWKRVGKRIPTYHMRVSRFQDFEKHNRGQAKGSKPPAPQPPLPCSNFNARQ